MLAKNGDTAVGEHSSQAPRARRVLGLVIGALVMGAAVTVAVADRTGGLDSDGWLAAPIDRALGLDGDVVPEEEPLDEATVAASAYDSMNKSMSRVDFVWIDVTVGLPLSMTDAEWEQAKADNPDLSAGIGSRREIIDRWAESVIETADTESAYVTQWQSWPAYADLDTAQLAAAATEVLAAIRAQAEHALAHGQESPELSADVERATAAFADAQDAFERQYDLTVVHY